MFWSRVGADFVRALYAPGKTLPGAYKARTKSAPNLLQNTLHGKRALGEAHCNWIAHQFNHIHHVIIYTANVINLCSWLSSHFEGSSTSVGRPGYCHSPVIAVKNIDARQPILLYISSDGILVLAFLWASDLLPPCPALISSYGYHIYVLHGHGVVASTSCVLLSAELLLLSWSLHFLCGLSWRLMPCIHCNILISVLQRALIPAHKYWGAAVVNNI